MNNCPKCNMPMEYHSTSPMVLMSYPPQRQNIYICRNCKVKTIVRGQGKMPNTPEDIGDYKLI